MFIPFKFKKIKKQISDTSIKILDIGSGNHSATITKKWFPKCNYTGLDKDKSYNNDDEDLKRMDHFIELDLTTLEFDSIPDNYFDVLIMSHVIEHLPNGDQVFINLIKKLKKGGIAYLEYPSQKSVNFPSMRGSLNFFDDPTHCRIYSVKELCNLLMKENQQILEAGTRRSYFNIILMPIKIVANFLTKGHLVGGIFWDLLGFAEYIVVKKVENQ